MRRLITDEDLAKITTVQNRLGEDVKITAFTSVVSCGFLHQYRLLEPQFSNILYFEGYLSTNDGGQGYYAKTDDENEDDIGIYITIAGTKYKRIFTGPVKLEWFSIDTAAAITKAIKYGNIELDYNKVYYLYRPISLSITNNVAINMNASTITYISKCNTLITIDAPNTDYFIIQRGTIIARKCSKAIRFINRPKYIDCNTLMTYKPSTLTIASPRLLTNKTASISGIKTFTQPITSVEPVKNTDLVTNKYLVDKSVAANIATIDKDAVVDSATFTGAVYVDETTSLDIDDDRVVTREILPVLAQHLFDTKVKPYIHVQSVCPIAVGGNYIQFSSHGGRFDPLAHPIIVWANSCWTPINFERGASVSIGSTPEAQKLVYVSNQGTGQSDAFYASLYKRSEPFIDKSVSNALVINRNGKPIDGVNYKIYKYKENVNGAFNVMEFSMIIPPQLSSYRYSIEAVKLNTDYNKDISFSRTDTNFTLTLDVGFYSLAILVTFTHSDGRQQAIIKKFTVEVLPGCSIAGTIGNMQKCYILKAPSYRDTIKYTNASNIPQTFIIWNRYYTDMQTHITPRADSQMIPPSATNVCSFAIPRAISTALYYSINEGDWQIVRVNTAQGKVRKRNRPSHSWPHVDLDSTYWSVSSRTDSRCDTNSVWSTIEDRVESVDITLQPGDSVSFAYFAFSQYTGQAYPPSTQYEVNGADIANGSAYYDTDNDYGIQGRVLKLGQCYMPDKNAPLLLIFK